MDKLVNRINFNRVYSAGQNWLTQSSTIKQLTIENSVVATLAGLPLNSTVNNTTVSTALAIGPNGYGTAQSMHANGLIAPSVIAGLSQVSVSATSYSGGTISMALTDPNIGAFVHTAVPGFKYVLGDDHCPYCGSPQVVFTITGVRIDATNYYWDTDLLSVPTATCSGSPCPKYESFGAQTITQSFTPTINLLQLAPP